MVGLCVFPILRGESVFICMQDSFILLGGSYCCYMQIRTRVDTECPKGWTVAAIKLLSFSAKCRLCHNARETLEGRRMETFFFLCLPTLSATAW